MIKPDSERNWVLIWAAVIVLLSSVPYLWGLAIMPGGYNFLGLTHNIDDGAVYLSWMRQAADGHFLIRNLYTTDPQCAIQFNVFFLVMGWLAAATRLPLIWVYHIFRAGLGVGVILAVWKLSKLFLDDANERRLLVPLIGLSAGVGWLIPGARPPGGPVDVWQPEAITFLSIYLNPLFLAGLVLMIGSFYFLVLAHRTGSVSHAVYAGLCMLLLGNVHTYDLLTVACVWTAYLMVDMISARRFATRTVALSALAACIAAPSVAYQFYVYASDPVYRARVNTPIPSPPIWSFFVGYGLVLLGAVAGWITIARRHIFNCQPSTVNRQLLLVVWSVIGFALPYIPVAQQRKLIMGLHIPLCILCAIALAGLLSRIKRPLARGLALAFILFTTGSNLAFISHDMLLLSIDETAPGYAPYMSTGEMNAMGYLRAKLKPRDVVFAQPTFSLFVPALSGRTVYYGHWSETPGYKFKISAWMRFVNPRTPDWARVLILEDSEATFYVSTSARTLPSARFVSQALKRVYRSGEVRVFKVDISSD